MSAEIALLIVVAAMLTGLVTGLWLGYASGYSRGVADTLVGEAAPADITPMLGQQVYVPVHLNVTEGCPICGQPVRAASRDPARSDRAQLPQYSGLPL